MIKYHSIKFKNFLSYGNSLTEYNFETGVTRLSGKTGEGKSSISEAFYFALFGKPYKNLNLSQLVNSINKKELEVYLHFSLADGTEYWIDRGIKPNFFRIYKNVYDDSGIIQLEAKTRSYQEMLEEDILKFNANMFNQTTYKSLTKDSAFLKLPTKDKRSIVDEILNSKIYFQMNAAAKLKVDSLTKELESISKDIKHLEVLIEQETDNINNLEKIKAQQEHTSSTRMNEIKSQTKKYETEIEKNKISIEEIQKHKSKKLELQKQMTDFNMEIQTLLKKRDDDLFDMNKSYQSEYKILNTQTEDLIKKETQNGKTETDDAYQHKNEMIKKHNLEHTIEFEKLNSKLNDVSGKISATKNKVKFLKETCHDCPNISKIVEDDNIEELLSVKAFLTKEMTLKKDENDFVLSMLEKTYNDLYESVQKRVEEYTKLKRSDAAYQLDNLELKYTKEVKQVHSKVNDDVKTIKDEIEKIKPELDKCIEYANMELALTSQIESLCSLINDLNKEHAKIINNKIEIDYTRNENYLLQKTELCKRYDTLSIDKNHFSFARNLLSDENIKSFVVKGYLPSINKLLNKNLQLFTDSIVMDFDEEFEPVFKSRHKESFTYESYSEGQKRMINISILFMWIEFCAIKYQNAISNVLILDEVTVGLDVELQNLFYDIIKRIAKDSNKNIIIMQHGEISTEHIDRLYEVKIVNGFSKLNLIGG